MVDAAIMVENAISGWNKVQQTGLKPSSRRPKGQRPLFFSLLVLPYHPAISLEARRERLFTPGYTKTFAMLFATVLSVTLILYDGPPIEGTSGRPSP
jgi:Cu/Ag efflux pump CusA